MAYTPDQDAALRDLEAAAKKVRSGAPTAEKQYGAAYQKCVALGVKPAIRHRYR